MDERDPKYPNRKSTRLLHYDYRWSGWYYVTICTKDRKNFFGEIVDQDMCLSPIGKVVHSYWEEIPIHFPNVTLDEFVVMPNHLHGIIVLNPDNTSIDGETDVACGETDVACGETDVACGETDVACGETDVACGETDVACGETDVACNVPTAIHMSRISPKAASLSVIIRSFKSACTRAINQQDSQKQFGWQSGFYEHIIRDETDLERIRIYIQDNPENWDTDKLNT